MEIYSSNFIVEVAFTQWIKWYKKRPIITSVSTIILLAVLGTIGVVIINSAKRAEEARKQASASYAQQIDTLTTTETNLKNLIEFVESEKQRLSESEKILENLRNEEKLLKPIVESDRKTVESLLAVQNQKAQENASFERWIGFGLGILASFLASILYASVVFIINYRKKQINGYRKKKQID